MAEDARDSEAAWRDLVAHFTMPDAAGAPAPWPDRENLPEPAAPGAPASGPEGTSAGPESSAGGPENGAGGPGGAPGGPDDDAGTGAEAPGELPGSGIDPVPGVIPAPPRIRIVRPATPVPPPPANDDEHYVPPPPPPLPRLDPISKGAWAALFGGPAYLLLAVLVGWQIPSVVALIAVAAFVGGFTTLVLRMQDRPPTDSGPDDGAVV
jgi:hypothetical protein